MLLYRSCKNFKRNGGNGYLLYNADGVWTSITVFQWGSGEAAFVYDVDIRDVEDDTSWEDTCMGMDFDEFLGDAEIIDSADI